MTSRWHLTRAICLLALLPACTALAPPPKKTLEFEHLVTVLKPIEKVPVTISFEDGMFYHVQVQNTLSSAITLVWNESSYVNTRRESVRLIRITDRKNLPSAPYPQQADSPIAPGSQLQADVIGESWIDLARNGGLPKPKDVFRKARIYLQFNIKGKRVDWQGEVSFVKRTQPN